MTSFGVVTHSDTSRREDVALDEPPVAGIARIAITGDGASTDVVARLSEELRLPIADNTSEKFDLLLAARADRLELRETRPGAPGAVYVDLLGCSPGEYRRRVGSRRQPIARAVGLPDDRPSVLDATAGLGRDAFRLAMLGCRVTAVERSPIVGALLRDGLRRAQAVPELDEIIAERLLLHVGDARWHLSSLAEDARPDVVYLDPMFPTVNGASALVKKEMRSFRLLVGDDDDAGELFNEARRVARRRVVVKRMPHTPLLGGEPDITFKGKIARYDVYLVQSAL